MTRYYDYVLGLIPVAMIAVAGSLGLAGHTLPVAVSVGAAAAILVIGHALFVNGPTGVPPVPDVPTTGGAEPSEQVADD